KTISASQPASVVIGWRRDRSAHLRQVVGTGDRVGIGRRLSGIRCRLTALLLLLPPMAGHAALSARLACFPTRPFVRGALLVRRFPALARDLALLVAVHRCKATILFCHAILLALPCSQTLGLQPMCHEMRVTPEPTMS